MPVLAISIFMLGCGSSAPGASSSTANTSPTAAPPIATPATQTSGPPAPVVEVRIAGNAFQPPALEVRPGTTVRWINTDPEEHDVVAKDGSFEAQPFGTGVTFQQVFAAAGAFPYYCDLHKDMEGTITVR